MFVLTKFFEKEFYRDQFIDGNLYLSSFSTFTQTIPERPLNALAENGNEWAIETLKKQHNIDQRDIFEGTVGTVSLENCLNEIDKGLIPLICMDPSIRGSGFDYCNLTCLCKTDINYLLLKSPSFVYTMPDMRNFGKYAIIIKDIDAFAKRVGKSLNKLGYHYNIGSVMYHQPSFYEGFNNHMPHVTVICDPEIKLDDPYLYRKHAYDCFDKSIQYKNQNEWRIVVKTGKKNTDPIQINVGSLADLVVKVPIGKFEKTLGTLLKMRSIQFREDKFYGNVTRKQLDEEIAALGDQKGRLLITFMQH